MSTSTPLGFGGIERRVDERDFELGAYQPPSTIPDVFLPNLSNLSVYYQGDYPTCGAHAGAFFNSKLQSDRVGTTKTLSPKYLWKQIKNIDGFPLEDGTDLTSILKSLAGTGDCDLTLMQNTFDGSLQEYSRIANITNSIQSNGTQNLVRNYAFTNRPTMAQLKQAIYRNRAVIALVDIGDGWWINGWNHALPLKVGNFVGHHFIVLWGYDNTKIYFRNSWGTEWGNRGDGYFDATYMSHVLEIGTALALPNQFIFTKDMQYGDSNNDVIQLQRRLGVVPDSGWFGPLTKEAVTKYQKDNGIMPATKIYGYVGSVTRARLNTTV